MNKVYSSWRLSSIIDIRKYSWKLQDCFFFQCYSKKEKERKKLVSASPSATLDDAFERGKTFSFSRLFWSDFSSVLCVQQQPVVSLQYVRHVGACFMIYIRVILMRVLFYGPQSVPGRRGKSFFDLFLPLATEETGPEKNIDTIRLLFYCFHKSTLVILEVVTRVSLYTRVATYWQ